MPERKTGISAALEHRLTTIEEAQKNSAVLAVQNHSLMMQAAGKIEGTIERQNGRIGKLETWRAQWQVGYAVVLIAGPFIFYALTRLFG